MAIEFNKSSGHPEDHPKKIEHPKSCEIPLHPDTYNKVLSQSIRLATSPISYKVYYDGLKSFDQAVEEGKIDPTQIAPRCAIYDGPIGDPDYISKLEVVTFGESSSISNKDDEGGQNLAELEIRIEYDPDKDRDPNRGEINVVLGVTTRREITYKFLSYKEDPDINASEDITNAYDVWGVPHKDSSNQNGGRLTEKQARKLLMQLKQLDK